MKRNAEIPFERTGLDGWIAPKICVSSGFLKAWMHSEQRYLGIYLSLCKDMSFTLHCILRELITGHITINSNIGTIEPYPLYCHLNEGWVKGDGGELKIHKPLERVVDPVFNRLVLFRSDTVLHEVLPARKPRRSLTGWLLKQPSDVGILGI